MTSFHLDICSKSKYYVVLYANRYEYFIFKAITNITIPVTNPDVTNEKILGTKINVRNKRRIIDFSHDSCMNHFVKLDVLCIWTNNFEKNTYTTIRNQLGDFFFQAFLASSSFAIWIFAQHPQQTDATTSSKSDPWIPYCFLNFRRVKKVEI